MREIRFRAWHKPSKVMLNDCQEFYDTLGDERRGNKWEPQSFRVVVDNEDNEYELMQFTGLKDKNGKEIYEGDIVRWHETYDWEDYHGKKIFEVSLKSFRFWLDGELFGYEGELLIEPEYCEIIGNIHETPTLISGQSENEEGR